MVLNAAIAHGMIWLLMLSAGAPAFGNPPCTQRGKPGPTRRVLILVWLEPVDRISFRNHPVAQKLAAAGVRFDSSRLGARTAGDVARSILTGARPGEAAQPTLFEYLRKDRGLASWQTWLITSGNGAASKLKLSTHPRYGSRFGPRQLNLAPLFSSQLFKSDSLAAPSPAAPRSLPLLNMLDGSAMGARSSGPAPAAARWTLADELLARLADKEWRALPGAIDRTAILAAGALLEKIQEGVVVTLLGQASRGDARDKARGLAATLDAVGVVWARISGSEALRKHTAIFLVPGRATSPVPEPGRSPSGSKQETTSIITVAPEFHRGKVVTSGVQVEDVCATVCRLLGIKTIKARSRQLKAAFR